MFKNLLSRLRPKRGKAFTLPLVTGVAGGAALCFANYPVRKLPDGKFIEAFPDFTTHLLSAIESAIGHDNTFAARATDAPVQIILNIKKMPPLRVDIALHNTNQNIMDSIPAALTAAHKTHKIGS